MTKTLNQSELIVTLEELWPPKHSTSDQSLAAWHHLSTETSLRTPKSKKRIQRQGQSLQMQVWVKWELNAKDQTPWDASSGLCEPQVHTVEQRYGHSANRGRGQKGQWA